MGKVFVVQNRYNRDASGKLVPFYDLSNATEFGELVEVLDGRLSPLANGPAMSELRMVLRNFSDDDHLLTIGAPAFLMAAAMVAAHFNNGRVKVLHWDKSQGKYISVSFNL